MHRLHLDVPRAIDAEAALHATEKFWRDWSDHGKSSGKWSHAVQRSLITLKALTYEPTGGLVAAPTTSLPERIGGIRNWDYRYCWLRDATLTLLALMNANCFDEAAAWRRWLQRAVAGSPEQMQIMYGLAGERRLRTVDRTRGSPAMRTQNRCASATPQHHNCNSTSLEKSWTRCIRHAKADWTLSGDVGDSAQDA